MQDTRPYQDNTAAFPGTKFVTDFKSGDVEEKHYFGMNQRQYLAYKLAPEVMKIMSRNSLWENVKNIFRKNHKATVPNGEQLAKICFQIADGFIEYGKKQSFKHNNSNE